jgi:hypothetical protein
MTDLNKIPGAAPNDPARGPREPAKPGTEKFKDLMKVDKSGDQQKKKKKRQEESEEETKAELRAGNVGPDKAIEGSKKDVPKIQKVGESEKKQPQHQKRAEEAAAMDEEAAINVNRQKIEAFNLENVESASLEKTKKAPVYTGQTLDKNQEVKEEVEAIEKKDDQKKITISKHVPKEATASPLAVTPASTTLGPSFIAPASETSPGYMQLNTEMLALFEKMVGLIMVMQAKGDSETTIHLNTPEFASSMFAGAQITIREFSTAPTVYNIEFVGTDQNNAIFDANIASLRAAFDSEKRNYSINRIESRLSSEKPLFHRKGKIQNQNEEASQ